MNSVQTFNQSIKDPNLTKYKNKDYSEVIRDTTNSGYNFSLTPNKKFQTLYLQVAAIGSEVKINIEDNHGRLLKTETVTVNDGLKTIEANIAGLSDVTVFYKYEDKDGNAGVFIPLSTSYYK